MTLRAEHVCKSLHFSQAGHSDKICYLQCSIAVLTVMHVQDGV